MKRTLPVKLLLLCFFTASLAAFRPAITDNEITYEQFLEWRDQPDTVVLNSLELEPFFHVTPEGQNGISQEELNSILSEMIPAKDTRIILFCENNFFASRMVMARDVAGWTLPQMGYENIYKLEKLWLREDLFESGDLYNSIDTQAVELGEKEVKPYAVSLPQSAQNYLDRLEKTPYNSKLIQQEEAQ